MSTSPAIILYVEQNRMLLQTAEEARRAGADAFLRKPNNLIELVETIKRLLDVRASG